MKREKHNHLAAAEMSEEENYNQIDGIVTSTPKPSLMEKIREYEQRIAENNCCANGGEPKKCCPSKDEI